MNFSFQRRGPASAPALVGPFARTGLATALLGALLVACGGTRVAVTPPQGAQPGCRAVQGGVGGSALQGLSLPGVMAGDVMAAGPARWNAPRAQGQVLILRAPGALSAQALGALAQVRSEQVAENLTLVYTPVGQTDEAFAARLAAAGLRVQPNYRYQALAVPNDPGYPGNAGLLGGQQQSYLSRIRAAGAWSTLAAGCVSAPVTVAVLDTGITRNHPDFTGTQILPGKDFCSKLSEDAKACTGTDDDPSELAEGVERGHGTSSAGLIGASANNGKGIAGVAWSGRGTTMLARILPVKVFGSNSNGDSGALTSSLAQGLDYARTQGARVINMSLGTPGDNKDTALSDAIGRASSAGIVMVAAAGNTPDDGLYYPASDPRVLAVGAADSNNNLTSYSARSSPEQLKQGLQLDLIAPGGVGGVGSSENILTLSPSGYTFQAGTSEAAPQVSGVAALMLAYRPSLTGAQVGQILRDTAQNQGGYRFLDANAALARVAASH